MQGFSDNPRLSACDGNRRSGRGVGDKDLQEEKALSKERLKMPNIKPVSDLRNYAEVLNEAKEGSPVFLTKNGRGEYVILNMEEYDKMREIITFVSELEQKERLTKEKCRILGNDVQESGNP